MWTRSARWDQACRTSHIRFATAIHKNLATGVLTNLPIEDGSVTVDCTADVRRVLALSTTPTQAFWDVLQAPGGEITVTQTIRYIDHAIETVPLGVFVVDQMAIGYRPDDTLSMTCPDRWVKVQRNRFAPGAKTSVASNATWQEIKRLVEGAWSVAYPFPGWAAGSPGTSATTKVGPLLWDNGERATAITDMATASSVEVYFDNAGKAVLRPVPSLSNTSPEVWRVDASATGVMIGADNSADLSRTRNAVIVSSSAADLVVTPQEWKNTTVGDPLAVGGPLGYVPLYYSSPLIRTTTQALATAKTLLSTQLGLAKVMSLEATGNAALDARDVIGVVLPRIDRTTARPYELHMVDSVVHPLMPTGTQTIQTRSTRADAP